MLEASADMLEQEHLVSPVEVISESTRCMDVPEVRAMC